MNSVISFLSKLFFARSSSRCGRVSLSSQDLGILFRYQYMAFRCGGSHFFSEYRWNWLAIAYFPEEVVCTPPFCIHGDLKFGFAQLRYIRIHW